MLLSIIVFYYFIISNFQIDNFNSLTSNEESFIGEKELFIQSNNEELTSFNINAGAFNIEKSLPLGYVKDGSRDYTKYIQRAIDRHSELVFPGFPILINDSGLNIPSNRTLYFNKGSQLILKPSYKGHYNIIKIKGASNITLHNPYIIGDRYKHKGNSGEWGMGIGIYGASNIKISNARIYNCWGDGIYLGKSGSITNKNITLIEPYCKSNRRDGISVIDANGLKIISPYAGYSDGTAPFCGINIEPNDHTNEIKNIQIIDPVTEGNKGNGIQAGLGKLYGKINKEVSITILNHTDIASGTGFKATCRTTFRKGSEIVSGIISIKGSNWKKNTKQPLSVYLPENSMKFALTKPQVMNRSGVYLNNLQVKSVLTDNKSIWRPTTYSLTF